MPGYKALPEDVAGPAAEQVRCAEVLQRAGNFVEATHLLEVTLEASTLGAPCLPAGCAAV